MDNVVIPYQEISDSSSEEYDDSSDDNIYDHQLSNNISTYFNNFNNQNNFINFENSKDYENLRNKYFTPELVKIRLLIDSKNINHSENHSTSNYNIYLKGANIDNNKNSGYSNLNNIIGFKLIKAIIHNSIYNVNNNNNTFQLQFENGSPITVTLDNGSYNFTEMGTHLLSKLTAIDGAIFTLTSDLITYKYSITHIGTKFRFLWNSSYGYTYRLFGFMNIDTEYKLSHTSQHVVQQNSHFVDLVIPEIPYIACKKNSNGKHIIDRIPLDKNSGSLIYYSTDINLDNYFYPINLDKINIQLYEDSTDIFYDCQNNDNSFEFEVTMINKLF